MAICGNISEMTNLTPIAGKTDSLPTLAAALVCPEIPCAGTCTAAQSAALLSRTSYSGFLDYQGQRFDHPATAQGINVFTAAERGGDFSGLCTGGFTGGICNDRGSKGQPINQLYNPCAPGSGGTGPVCAPNPSGPQPFPNNQIPLTMLDPVAQALFASPLYPHAISNNITGNNAFYTQTQQFNTNQYDVKVDFNATEKDHPLGALLPCPSKQPNYQFGCNIRNGFLRSTD